MRRFLRDALITLVLVGFVAGVMGFAIAREGGLGAVTHEPSRLEELIADQGLQLSIPKAAHDAVNPHAGDANAWKSAVPEFSEHCAVCHGADGHGKTEIGPHMYPRVPDLASARVQHYTDGGLFHIIQTGVRLTGMPGFQDAVSEDEAWRLVSFVRRVPGLTAADFDHLHADVTASSAAGATTIVMDGTRFHPDDLTVKIGTKVTWTNKDFFPHNVVSQTGHLHSGSMDPGQSWSATLSTRGTINYVCTFHPGMKGTIHVQ